MENWNNEHVAQFIDTMHCGVSPLSYTSNTKLGAYSSAQFLYCNLKNLWLVLQVKVCVVNSAGGSFSWNYATNYVIMQVTTSVTIMQDLRLYCIMQIVLSVTVVLVDLSVAIMQVTVSVAITQSEVSAAFMQVTASLANMLVTFFIVIMQVGALLQILQLFFSAVNYAGDCFYYNYLGDYFCYSYVVDSFK